jgi:ubiquinone biosynthesis protein COQ9
VLDWIVKTRLDNAHYTKRLGYSAADVSHLLESIQDARAEYKQVLAEGGVPVKP